MNNGGKYDSEMHDDILYAGEKSEYPEKDNGLKWRSLEHRGVTFFQGYEAHGVKLLYQGEAVDVNPEVEEICNWWA